MHLRSRTSLTCLLALLGAMPAARPANAALTVGLIDRKFPVFSYCPIDARAGSLVSFVAPANGAVRITFAMDNFYPTDPFDPQSRAFNDPHIDNVMVMTRSHWDAAQTFCSAECFTQAGVHTPAPTHPSDAASLADVAFHELFDSDPFATASPLWQGGSWDPASTAPNGDATGTECTGQGTSSGSLRLGTAADGDVVASSMVTVSGLTPGVEYVVIGWLYLERTFDCENLGLTDPCWAQTQIIVDESEPLPAATTGFGALKARYGARP